MHKSRTTVLLAITCLIALSVLVGCDASLTSPEPSPSLFSEPESTLDKAELLTLDSGVVVEKKDDKYFWHGDIVLSEEQLEALKNTGTIFPPDGSRNDYFPDSTATDPSKGVFSIASPNNVGVYPTSYNLWAMVRYVLSPGLSYGQRQTIQSAIDHWEANTDVRFYNATGEPTVDPVYGFEYPYVYFISGNSNYSYVGRIGGEQELSLTSFASTGTAIHEIGHAIGLFHEQSRIDRNDHVTVNYSNIIPGKENNFDRITQNYSIIGSFDFESVMLYSSYAFSHNGSPTITKKDGSTFASSGTLSESDIAWANEYYYPFEEQPSPPPEFTVSIDGPSSVQHSSYNTYSISVSNAPGNVDSYSWLLDGEPVGSGSTFSHTFFNDTDVYQTRSIEVEVESEGEFVSDLQNVSVSPGGSDGDCPPNVLICPATAD